MYHKITHRQGVTLIDSRIVEEVDELLNKVIESLNHQTDDENLLCWLVDMFNDDFAEEYGEYSLDTLSKLALCILNAKHYLIHDVSQFCDHFNAENLDLEIGFDGAFYPVGVGCWYGRSEFVLIGNEELDK
ncbi:hypothetical protein J7384_17130 [Endozoicomonas sp. G2_1]|uniref:hypothetical protein n=1 Tax=Endozoicomonas sp. G2_1 TaxID=2821091 RepID=UPI001ADBCE10|nr:hypothetical protein [Endozoicomonas sp. G2_1]MBO9492088.1 hypothetical protein [Endozoicomonas sp. G2_1]